MGLFDRMRGLGRPPAEPPVVHRPSRPVAVSAHLFGGDEDLEIVGEASYQDALWTICRGSLGDQVRHRVVAVVVPEPDNPYDPNAIAVHVEGDRVGYLAREDAARYGPGLHGLMERCGGYVALSGVIVGGGYYDDGPGRLGVWLDHDPADFGLRPSRRTGPAGRPGWPSRGRPWGNADWVQRGVDDRPR